TEAHIDVAALLEELARQVLDRLGGGFVHDVDVEAGGEFGEHAGVFGEVPELGPESDFGVGAVELLRPLLHRGYFAHVRDRGESVGADAQAQCRDVCGHDKYSTIGRLRLRDSQWASAWASAKDPCSQPCARAMTSQPAPSRSRTTRTA